MKTFIAKKLFPLILFLSLTSAMGQSEPDLEIGVFPSYKVGSEHILFIDGDAGEILSFAVLKEPVFGLAVSKEEGLFFALSRHFVFKGDIASGNITDEYQFMEILEQGEKDLIDPNLNIRPYGISTSGIAFFQYNTPRTDVAHESVESRLRQEIYMADINTRTTSAYNKEKFHMNKKMFLGFGEGKLFSYDKIEKEWKTEDLNSGKAETVSFQPIYQKYPELNDYYSNVPVQIDEKHFMFVFIDPTTMKASGEATGIEIKFDIEAREIVEAKRFKNTASESTYPVLGFDRKSKRKLYGKKECDQSPMPTMPETPPLKGRSKKKLAQWQEENDRIHNEYLKDLAEWKEKSSNPMEQCEITIYEDKELTRPVFKIPNSMGATIYSDKYAMVKRGYEIALYNIEDQELVWSIDTDF